MGQRVLRIGGERRVELRQCLAVGLLARVREEQRLTEQVSVVGRDDGGAAHRTPRCHLHGERAGDRPCDLALHHEDVVDLALEGLGPSAEARSRIGEFRDHAYIGPGPLHAAFEQIGDAELAADRLRVLLMVAESARGGGRRHLQRGVAGQRRADLGGETVGEIRLLGITAEVGERQDSDAARLGAAARRAQPDDAADRRGCGGARTADEQHPSIDPLRAGRRDCGARRHRIRAGRSDGARYDALQPFQQAAERRLIRAALPARKIGHLELAEPERRHRPVEGQRREPAVVASGRRLVRDPVARDAGLRPEDHHGLGGLELCLRLGEIVDAGRELPVPPAPVARRLQRGGEPLHIARILARVRQEDVGGIGHAGIRTLPLTR